MLVQGNPVMPRAPRRPHPSALPPGVKPALASGRWPMPGNRASLDANYYGAFVRDPDGNKIEAVCFMAK